MEELFFPKEWAVGSNPTEDTMIIWTSSIEIDSEIKFVDMGIRFWRQRIELSWFGIEWRRELKYKDFDWRPIECKSVELRCPWTFERFHTGYDGPHCAWSVGFLHIYWPRDNCKKCINKC